MCAQVLSWMCTRWEVGFEPSHHVTTRRGDVQQHRAARPGLEPPLCLHTEKKTTAVSSAISAAATAAAAAVRLTGIQCWTLSCALPCAAHPVAEQTLQSSCEYSRGEDSSNLQAGHSASPVHDAPAPEPTNVELRAQILLGGSSAALIVPRAVM
mmetsp:Transcript_81178/g.243302  ORF Transcript_81178/g.243302 Transcript_81178/m.243302 type:complete len:154 (+) Transcript_81178:1113-1574(+)